MRTGEEDRAQTLLDMARVNMVKCLFACSRLSHTSSLSWKLDIAISTAMARYFFNTLKAANPAQKASWGRGKPETGR